jgi:ubiquinone biosynthesis protein Coq4
MTAKRLLQVQLIHPKVFKEKHKLSVYELHRLTNYPEETLKHWLASPESDRYQCPKSYVLNHFGLLDLQLSV